MANEDQHYQQGRFTESTTDPPICHEQCFTNLDESELELWPVGLWFYYLHVNPHRLKNTVGDV